MALAIAEMTFSIGDRLIKQEADEFVAEIERLYTRLFSEGPGILQEYRKPHPEAEHFKPSIVFWRQISRLAGRSQAFRPTSVAPLTLAISSLEIEVTAYCLQANLDELKEHVLRVRTQLFDRIARAEELEQEKEKI